MNGPTLLAARQTPVLPRLVIPEHTPSLFQLADKAPPSATVDALDLATSSSGGSSPVSDMTLDSSKAATAFGGRPPLYIAHSDYALGPKMNLQAKPIARMPLVKARLATLTAPLNKIWSRVSDTLDRVNLGGKTDGFQLGIVGIRHEGQATVGESVRGSVVLKAKSSQPIKGHLHTVQYRGQTKHAGLLLRARRDLRLTRIDSRGHVREIGDGCYSFIVDLNHLLLVNAWGGGGAQHGLQGAHLDLSGSLPVRYAGELYVQNDRIVAFSPRSGSYRTPERFNEVARAHPLLAQARILPVVD